MPAFINSKSHLVLCTVAVLVAPSCGSRTTLDSVSSPPGTADTAPKSNTGTLGGMPDASAPASGLKADAGVTPDLAPLVAPDASVSDLSQIVPVPQPLGPDADLRGGAVADAGVSMVVAPDAGARGPSGIGDSGLTPAGRDAGFALTLPGGRYRSRLPERVAPSG
jgi:hypothetical protein